MSTRDSTQGDESTTVMGFSPGIQSMSPATTDDALVALHSNILRCFICREPPTDPIYTTCGDVFCWPCMHQWLQNEPRACPACGYTLRRDLDIIPLYGAGASANSGTSAGTNTAADEATSDIPPRPRNPLLLRTATPTRAPTATPDVDNFSGLVLTPSSLLTAYERSIHQLSEFLEVERARVMTLGFDRIDLELQVSDLEHQNTELRRAVHDREWVLGKERDEMVRSGFRVRALEERNMRLACEAEEGREREKRHIERGHQMAELIARLQRRLEGADRQLPQGWST